jgi:23S rRNA (guanosine2251-2'-O)-methyltransferase
MEASIDAGDENHAAERQIAILLHDIRSAHNVGAIFRTADASGATKVYLSGYTPKPIDRFGRRSKEIGKTALGGELSIPWEYQESPMGIIAGLKRDGWQIVGVEQDAHSIDYRDYRDYQSSRSAGKILVIIGNEVEGVSRALLDQCDVILEIPMHGTKESLNVAVAAGIVLFAIN